MLKAGGGGGGGGKDRQVQLEQGLDSRSWQFVGATYVCRIFVGIQYCARLPEVSLIVSDFSHFTISVYGSSCKSLPVLVSLSILFPFTF